MKKFISALLYVTQKVYYILLSQKSLKLCIFCSSQCKTFIAFNIAVFTFISLFASAYAAPSIAEKPDIKIVINGKIRTFQCVPIIVNGHTLLPLRDMLSKLDVANDDSHIIWNGNENSVKIIKDNIFVYLKVDSTSATLNGDDIALDVAPVNYKSHVYIPARFVSQSLGKKVVWDAASSSVLIKDEKNFDTITKIIGKANIAMKDVKKFKVGAAADICVDQNGESQDFDITASMEFDDAKDLSHMIMNYKTDNNKFSMEFYRVNKISYMKNPLTGKWSVSPDKSGSKDVISGNGGTGSSQINNSDILTAGLMADTSNPDEIVLKGDVYNSSILKSLKSFENITGFNTEIHIDSKTNYITKVISRVTSEGKPQSFEMNFSDFNGSDIDIKIPDEVKNILGNSL
ncbi:MAG TPA: DUF6612 family protein [Clostridia bacterium]